MSRPTRSPAGDPGAVAYPALPAERVDSIDILRGFALIGVVLINFQWMINWGAFSTGFNGLTVWFLKTLVAGKFFRLFAFLFGLGFTLQMGRLESRGVRFIRVYLRRLAILFVFGVLHGFLFWPEDILAAFAQLGLLLLILRRASSRVVAAAVLVSLLAFHAYHITAMAVNDRRSPATPEELVIQRDRLDAEREAQEAEEVRIRSEGTFSEVVRWNTRFFIGWRKSVSAQLGLLQEEFVMFLLGLYVGRRRILENASANLPFIRRAMWWGLLVGIVGLAASAALMAPFTGSWASRLTRGGSILSRNVGAASLTIGYASAFTVLLQRPAWLRRLAPLGAVGRTALTNYVLQSIVITTVMYDYGLGLYGRVTPLAGVGLAAVVFAAQILLSGWWLKRFRFGPAEWLWRSLTYAKIQPMRVWQGTSP